MRKVPALVLSLIIIIGVGVLSYSQTKPSVASTVDTTQELVVLTEDADLLTKAFQNLNDKKKDYELALAIADRVEADAAANLKVSRKDYELARNSKGELIFRVRLKK